MKNKPQIPMPYQLNWWGNFNTELYAKVIRAKANQINNNISKRLTELVKQK